MRCSVALPSSVTLVTRPVSSRLISASWSLSMASSQPLPMVMEIIGFSLRCNKGPPFGGPLDVEPAGNHRLLGIGREGQDDPFSTVVDGGVVSEPRLHR